jgi:hypothetical protein
LESVAYFRVALEPLGELRVVAEAQGRRPATGYDPEQMRRVATGDARVSGEMRVILTMMLRARRRAQPQTNAKKAAADRSVHAGNVDD